MYSIEIFEDDYVMSHNEGLYFHVNILIKWRREKVQAT